MNQGDIVQENAFTSYDNLRELIRKYNKNTEIMSSNLEIDETLTDIRDAIAHGRVSSNIPSPPMRLLKFERPNGDQVEVSFSELLTGDWFNTQISRFLSAVRRVRYAHDRLLGGDEGRL
jgi:predicted GTPase